MKLLFSRPTALILKHSFGSTYWTVITAAPSLHATQKILNVATSTCQLCHSNSENCLHVSYFSQDAKHWFQVDNRTRLHSNCSFFVRQCYTLWSLPFLPQTN